MSISQTTNTVQLNNIDDIYKGLKQNEYLIDVNSKLKKSLESCQKLSSQLDTSLSLKNSIILKQSSLIEGLSKEKELAIEDKNIEIQKQLEINKQYRKEAKRTGKKKFWTGFGVGTILGVTGTVIGILVLK